MPFTPAHVMAVLPGLRGRALDPTCLVLGAMAPDFEYFVRGAQTGAGFGHTPLGILAWGLPVTLVLAALYHGVVKWPLLVALPARATGVLGAPWGVTARAGPIAACVLAALLGNATHVLWDGVTHAHGLVTARVPELRTAYEVPGLGPMALHRILQHASTLVGLAVVAWYLGRRLARTPAPHVEISRATARLVFAGACALGVALLLARLQTWRTASLGSHVTAACSGVLAGTLVASLLLRGAGTRLRESLARRA